MMKVVLPVRAVSVVPALNLAARRKPRLEDLRRLTVEQLATGIPKPDHDDEVVAVEVVFGAVSSSLAPVPLELRTYAVGFGRRWAAACPRCGRPCSHLYLLDGGLCCWRCTGGRRFSERLGHREIYKRVLRPLRHAGILEHRAQRPRTRLATRERLSVEARGLVDRALAAVIDLRLRVDGATATQATSAKSGGAAP
jgi:hypothetical protein